ncbi:MAG: DNA polymerase IV [Bacteroidota bacterium]
MGGLDPNRAIVHMDLDTFFVSVERKKDNRLNGKPLIIGGTGDRGVVSSCSYEARAFGVHSAMPIRLAKRLCPHAILISGDFEAYSEHSHMVSDIVKEASPLYEKASIDEFYIDLSGMERFFGSYLWARDLRNKVMDETGLPISFGLSVNKMVAKVATGEAKPNGHLQIVAPQVSGFLAPMPVQKIPLVGKKTAQSLTYLGVKTVSNLREIPRPVLERVYGKQGTLLYRRARGEDDAPVIPYTEQKSMSTESTFSQDTIDIVKLRSVLTAMVEKLAFGLRKQRKLTACISVKLRYANFETFTRQARIPYTANDDVLIDKALHLFTRLYDRRIRVRLVGVRLSHLVPGGMQIDLFQDQVRQVDLFQALDGIKRKYGGSSIGKASGIYGGKRALRREDYTGEL